MSLRAILPPKDFIKKMKLGDVIRNRLQKTGEGIKKDLEKTTRTWKTKVVFQVKLDLARGTVRVTTRSKIWGWVDQGTKPHVITPKRAGILRFNSGFLPKTKPGFLGSSGGGSSPPVVFSKAVHHPGVKPRKFSQKVQVKWAYTFESQMKADIAKAVRGK